MNNSQINLAIETRGISHLYAKQVVALGADIAIKKHQTLGILGPRESGKSSLLSILSGKTKPLTGEIYFSGHNSAHEIAKIMHKIAVVPQKIVLDEGLRVADNLIFFAHFFGVKRKNIFLQAIDMLRLMQLDELSDQHITQLNSKLQRRLTLARALFVEPDILLLDQVTDNLERAEQIFLWNVITNARRKKLTIILTSNNWQEVEAFCEQVLIMDQGKIVAVGNPAILKQELIGQEVIDIIVDNQDFSYYLNRLNTNSLVQHTVGDHLYIFLKHVDDGRKICDLLPSAQLTIRQPNLSDVFLHLTGKEFV